MSEIAETIRGFYSDFVLRDLLSFVTPGALFTTILFFALSDFPILSYDGIRVFLTIINNIPIVSWILIFGLFYIIGVGLQLVGQIASKPSIKNFSIDLCFPPKDQTYPTYYSSKRIPFLSRSSHAEKKTHERFIVLMQASGNMCVAFLLIFVIGIWKIYQLSLFSVPGCHWLIGSLFWLISFIVCLYGFQNHRQKLLNWEEMVIKNHTLSNRSFSRSHCRRRS